MNDLQIGARISRLRRQRRVSQVDLAAAIDISSSYLNLIEHNRRKITVPLLLKIAGYFGVEAGELADSDEGRLTGDLMEMFGDEVFADADITNIEVRDLANANPAAGRAILRLYDRFRRGQPVQTAEVDPPEQFHQATDRISDFLQENANHFPTVEAAAERVRADIDAASDDFTVGLRGYLLNVFGIQVRFASLPHGVARSYDAARERLLISEILSSETATFLIAHHLGQLAAGLEINALIANLPEGDAPLLGRNVLAAYFAAALIMPYAVFQRACVDYRYDIDRVGRRFGASFEQVCHRMTTLQRPGALGIPLHLVRTDIAGNISKRFSLSGIRIPRHSGACPRWNVYLAFLSPERINVQVSQTPDGERFFCIAKATSKGDARYGAPLRHFSIGLGCSILHARAMIYSDGVDLNNPGAVIPVGTSCRICPRAECGQRAHPPADHRFKLDEATRPDGLYVRL
ncbi:MAG: short-chain fatty acyl-CoA regulator family protein [Paracoccaceae bacterium]